MLKARSATAVRGQQSFSRGEQLDFMARPYGRLHSDCAASGQGADLFQFLMLLFSARAFRCHPGSPDTDVSPASHIAPLMEIGTELNGVQLRDLQ